MVSNSEQQLTQVVWGTTINTSDAQQRFKNFLTNYTLEKDRDNINCVPYYMDQMKMIAETEIYVLNLDCRHLHEHDSSLYQQFIQHPSEMIPYFDAVVNQMFKELSTDE